MALANPVRGELHVKLGDEEFVLEPSFKKIAKLEAALGRSLVQLAVDLSRTQSLTFLDVALILHTVSKGGKRTLDEVGDLVVKHGLTAAMGPLQAFLERVLSGDDAGNAVPQAEANVD